MFVHEERDLEFGPDAVGARHEHRILVAIRLESEQASEAAQIGHHFRAKGRPHMRLDPLDEFIAGIDIDSGITIGSHWGRILTS